MAFEHLEGEWKEDSMQIYFCPCFDLTLIDLGQGLDLDSGLFWDYSQFVENVTIHFQYYIIVTGYYFGEYQKQAWVFVGEISSSISKKEIESGG